MNHSALAFAVLASTACFEPASLPSGSTSTGVGGSSTTGGSEGGSTTAPEGTSGSGSEPESTEDASTTASSSGTGESSSTTGAAGETVLFDLYAQRCAALWLSSPDEAGTTTQELVCDAAPGPYGGVSGVEEDELDGGDTAQFVLRATPWDGDLAVVAGIYEGIDLSTATAPVFRTRIDCPSGTITCAIAYQVLVRQAGAQGPPDFVEEGQESSDGEATDVEVDLSAYAGGAVKLTLVTMHAGPTNPESVGLWVHPRVIQ